MLFLLNFKTHIMKKSINKELENFKIKNPKKVVGGISGPIIEKKKIRVRRAG